MCFSFVVVIGMMSFILPPSILLLIQSNARSSRWIFDGHFESTTTGFSLNGLSCHRMGQAVMVAITVSRVSVYSKQSRHHSVKQCQKIKVEIVSNCLQLHFNVNHFWPLPARSRCAPPQKFNYFVHIITITKFSLLRRMPRQRPSPIAHRPNPTKPFFECFFFCPQFYLNVFSVDSGQHLHFIISIKLCCAHSILSPPKKTSGLSNESLSRPLHTHTHTHIGWTKLTKGNMFCAM